MDKPLETVVIGAGNRGKVYANYAIENPADLKIVGVVEPNLDRLNQFCQLHEIDPSNQFTSWNDLFKSDLTVDFVIISTPDRYHVEPAIMALKRGFHVLLEKPMALNPDDCLKLVITAKDENRLLQICYVLRYTNFFQKIKSLIDEKKIGDLVSIQMRENVSYYHYAHSYIRGNWRNRQSSAPMIVTKSSHDMDILYWLTGQYPKFISSFGSQQHFGLDNKPKDAPKRCIEGCPEEDTCLYYAPRIYLDIIPLLHVLNKGGNVKEKVVSSLTLRFPHLKSVPPFSAIKHYDGWPVNTISEKPDPKSKIKALEEGPYGRCVYDINDHDVVDNQVAIFHFDDNLTVNFTMIGHSSEEGRTLRIDGTKGTIYGQFMFSGSKIEIVDSLTSRKSLVFSDDINRGHGGGDMNLMKSFISKINNWGKDSDQVNESSLISHLMAFAVDKSRIENRVVNFRQEYLSSI